MPRTERRPSALRSLVYYWRIHLAVALGTAVTAAILTGALLVGDSMKGSLRDLTLERLGKIEYSLTSNGFFREQLASDMQAKGKAQFTPVISLEGSASHPVSKRRSSGIAVIGIDKRFEMLFRDPVEEFLSGEASVVINQSLSDELDAEIGDAILLSFSNKAAVNPEFLLGRREATALHKTLRLKIGSIISDRSLGRFSLDPHQTVPQIIYLPLEELQKALGREDRVNTLLVSAVTDGTSAPRLQEDFQSVLTLEDFGLRWRKSEEFVLESEEMLISPSLDSDIWEAVAELGIPAQPVFTYLANQISSERGSIPYSTVSALDMTGSKSWGRLKLISGAPLTHLGSNEILINHWAAQDLEVEVGDTITLTYYIPDWQETLNTRSSSFRLKGIVPMEGVAIDETLAPEITGIQDAKDIASWDPPIPIDYSLIRKRDEEYWDHYRAAPKAFLPYEAGVELWRNRFGRTTSVRFPDEGWALQEIESCLLQKLRSEQIGRFRATREEDLQAATGSTDFGMLFIGFSFFLIISSMLLVGLLFRLGVENRAPELGLLLSLGYPSRDVRRRFLIEGSVLAVAGSLVGLALACVYAGLLIAGLRTVWVAAIGSSFLRLHVSLETLIVGFFASLAAILLSLFLTFRALLKFPATSLLSGTIKRSGPVQTLWARIVLAISFGLAVLLLLSSFVILHKSSPIIFFLVGALLLISGLASFALWLRSESTSPIGSKPFAPGIELAARNSARSPGRSLLSVALVATACFVIVSVGANRSLPGAEVLDKDSGAGGFAARAQSDVPLVRDLNNPEVLFDLGFAETDVAKLDNVRFAAYRFRPGEDISCRNLYRPREPRLLGVSQKGIQRGGFRFQTAIRDVENPWTLLNDDLGKGILPAIADVNSATWILQLSLGDDLILKDANGEEIRLRLVGLLARSIFQSELLISETNFEKHFPEQRGHSYFLLEMPFDQFDEMTSVLERVLGRYGFDIHRTDRLLAGFLAIQNTYLSTFQSLGGLGLLLGTAGLGIILIRNTIERRSELAVLRAFGFRRRKLASLVLLENSFLLGLGIVLGSAAALIAVAPHVVSSSEDIPVISLAITLVVVFAFGFIVNLAALRFALRIPLLAALREE